MGGHVNPRSNHEVTLLGIYIWGTLELKAMVGVIWTTKDEEYTVQTTEYMLTACY